MAPWPWRGCGGGLWRRTQRGGFLTEAATKVTKVKRDGQICLSSCETYCPKGQELLVTRTQDKQVTTSHKRSATTQRDLQCTYLLRTNIAVDGQNPTHPDHPRCQPQFLLRSTALKSAKKAVLRKKIMDMCKLGCKHVQILWAVHDMHDLANSMLECVLLFES